MAADAVEKAGLRVAILDNRTITLLREKLPRESAVNNPIDVLGDADPERYATAIQSAQNDDSVDAVRTRTLLDNLLGGAAIFATGLEGLRNLLPPAPWSLLK